ncbi:hypothetical protein EZS27_014513 [termite gut metagenome]|uniref:Uncharacterized protein n=1 Tax=termite gut metagenome TaxID=433724 RepID=A0A5J4RVY3_9ZZZZ
MELEEFNKDIIRLNDWDKQRLFVHKFLFHGLPFVFKDKEAGYFEFRNRIANKFGIGFHEVFIVGSAKLGFSYRKETLFDYDSDIDVVIVNEKLFEKYYLKITDYQYQLDRNYQTIREEEKRIYNTFLTYLVKGWMRPDRLPTSFQVSLLKNEWFDFFKSISYGKSEVGDYKVAAGLFKNYNYLEKYHIKGIEDKYNALKNK